VPCARTPGHQENNNFCAVNINIGPGDSEWFGVPNDYWGALQNLCAKNKVDYLHGSWWPKIEELKEAGIPCYRFMQRPGDVVWVNVGCVHWVQASGWCNNIAWNVGPMTGRQMDLALERYEWNKSQRFQSIVAMCLLSWNIARNIKCSDAHFHRVCKSVLQQSLRASMQTQTFVKSKGVPVRFHGRKKNEPAHYCGICDEEVFNNLFIKEHEKKYVVHCLQCSLGLEPDLKGFICLEEYTEEELCQVYDDFVLYPRNSLLLGSNESQSQQD
jgi:histone demethylase